MTQTAYDIIVTPLTKKFNALQSTLDKLLAHCEEKNIKEDVFINDRLFPDMLPFAAQIRIATDMTKGAVMRLTSIEVPTFEDNETSIAEFKARIDRLLTLLASVPTDAFDGAEEKDIVIKRANGNEYRFTGLGYIHDFVIPNVYFHLTTAYNILRHRGVPLGKMDFLIGNVKV